MSKTNKKKDLKKWINYNLNEIGCKIEKIEVHVIDVKKVTPKLIGVYEVGSYVPDICLDFGICDYQELFF